jgi:hypothetical protein
MNVRTRKGCPAGFQNGAAFIIMFGHQWIIILETGQGELMNEPASHLALRSGPGLA